MLDVVGGDLACMFRLFAQLLAAIAQRIDGHEDPPQVLLCLPPERVLLRQLSLPQAALRGAMLGAAIEAAQFFLFSGVSQGVSVLSRAVGVALGATWLRGAVRGGWPALRLLVLQA